MNYLSLASDIIGVAGAIFALFAWLQARATRDDIAREQARQNERIDVDLVLNSNGKRHSLPIALPRRELSRAELLGRLGMLPMAEAGKRFSLTYLSKPGFLAQVSKAQTNSGEYTIEIPCTDQEFNQFDLGRV